MAGFINSQDYIVNGVDQRTIAQQRKDEKANEARRKAELERRKKVSAAARTEKGRKNKPKPFETPMTISGQSLKKKVAKTAAKPTTRVKKVK
jgi:hypothetical protein